MPQKIHFRDFWSRMFCSVGSSVSVAILCYLNMSGVFWSRVWDRKVRASAGRCLMGKEQAVRDRQTTTRLAHSRFGLRPRPSPRTFACHPAPSSELSSRRAWLRQHQTRKCTSRVRGVPTSCSACILIPGAALLLANEQRNAYGLRYNDYERYR